MLRVLIGDDQPDVLEAARLLLKSGGHTAVTAGTPEGVLKAAKESSFDLFLLDMNYARDTTSGSEGLDLLCGLRAAGIHAPVLVMTAWGSIDLAVEAMRRGAADFVQKPWDNTRLLDSVDKYGKQAKQARNDLEIAQKIQQNLLGREDKKIGGLEYSAGCLPAGEVGGDYYDFFDLGSDQLGVLLADVSGKGVSAAMLMAHLQAAMRSRLDLANSPADLIASVNRIFWESSPAEQFATLFYAVFDGKSKTLRYVNAGHVSGLLARSDRSFQELASTGTPVGLFKQWKGSESAIHLGSGDRVLMVSDGVVEAGIDTDREICLDECVRRAGNLAPAAMVARILSEAAHSSDDRTAVVLSVS